MTDVTKRGDSGHAGKALGVGQNNWREEAYSCFIATAPSLVQNTDGWVVDLVRQRPNRQPNKRFRIVAFYSGLIFSAAVMFVPVCIALLTWLRT